MPRIISLKFRCKINIFGHSPNILEVNCDFSSNNNVGTTFCAVFFAFCCVIYNVRD